MLESSFFIETFPIPQPVGSKYENLFMPENFVRDSDF